MATSVKKKNNSLLSSSLISNFHHQLLIPPNDAVVEHTSNHHHNSNNNNNNNAVAIAVVSSSSSSSSSSNYFEKPVVLITNGEGVDSPGLRFLVEALSSDGRFIIHVVAPQSDRSANSHAVTINETLVASSVEINGASRAFEVSGAVAAAREALICGVPSLCISLNWKKGESSENDLRDASRICLPLLYAAVRDVRKGIFPQNCSLNVEIPTCPLVNKGYKVTRQSNWRSSLSWQAVSTAHRHPSVGHFMSNQQSLGIKLAQLSQAASAAGAARQLSSNRKHVEIESIGVARKVNVQQTMKKYFRLEFLEKKQENQEEDLDIKALEDGYVAVTPFSCTGQSEIQALLSKWMAVTFASEQ